jgi:hypothetical protein
MKNIHVLPTNKPSELYINIQGDLSKSNSLLLRPKSRNIYITSDEEIKEEDWFISSGLIYKVNRNVNLINPNKDKKIILTTDTDLIKDGVQEIKDEFLEWFVKNPSCEFVETLFHYPTICDEGDYSLNLGYWTIIIPKEEPKQETLEEVAKKYSENWEEITGLDYENVIPSEVNKLDFINGAKWQAERMYSEEEVKKLLISCKNKFSGGDLEDYHSDSEVIEWFKKEIKIR